MATKVIIMAHQTRLPLLPLDTLHKARLTDCQLPLTTSVFYALLNLGSSTWPRNNQCVRERQQHAIHVTILRRSLASPLQNRTCLYVFPRIARFFFAFCFHIRGDHWHCQAVSHKNPFYSDFRPIYMTKSHLICLKCIAPSVRSRCRVDAKFLTNCS